MTEEDLKKELERLSNEYDLFFYMKELKDYKKYTKEAIKSHLEHLSEKIVSLEKLLQY